MLNRKSGPEPEMRTAGFQLLVDYEVGQVDPAQLVLRLSDSLAWIEGTTNVRASYIGNCSCTHGASAGARFIQRKWGWPE